MKPRKLRQLREGMDLTQDELAALLGVASGRVVRRWEAGEREIPAPTAALCTVYAEFPDIRKMAAKYKLKD